MVCVISIRGGLIKQFSMSKFIHCLSYTSSDVTMQQVKKIILYEK